MTVSVGATGRGAGRRRCVACWPPGPRGSSGSRTVRV